MVTWKQSEFFTRLELLESEIETQYTGDPSSLEDVIAFLAGKKEFHLSMSKRMMYHIDNFSDYDLLSYQHEKINHIPSGCIYKMYGWQDNPDIFNILFKEAASPSIIKSTKEEKKSRRSISKHLKNINNSLAPSIDSFFENVNKEYWDLIKNEIPKDNLVFKNGNDLIYSPSVPSTLENDPDITFLNVSWEKNKLTFKHLKLFSTPYYIEHYKPSIISSPKTIPSRSF